MMVDVEVQGDEISRLTVNALTLEESRKPDAPKGISVI